MRLIGPDSLRLAAPDSLRLAPSDSVRSVRPDSLGRRIRVLYDWRRSRLGTDSLAPSPRAEIRGEGSASSVEPMPRTILEWSLPFRRIPGGAAFLPDPVDAGDLPGREPPATLVAGIPLNQPGFPELEPDAYGPLWISRLAVHAPDPLRLPSNPTGGPLIVVELAEPDSGAASSGARATHGPNEAFVEEVFLARPLGSNLVRFFYNDHKTGGRYIYEGEFGENLLGRLDRGTSWGGLSAGWQQGLMRTRVTGGRRQVWNLSGLNAGIASRGTAWSRGWSGELNVQQSWERFLWDEPGRPAVRKSALTRGLLELRGAGARLRPLVTVQMDRQRQRFKQADGILLDRTSSGLGFATGLDGASKSWRWRGSAGRSAPAPRRAGWVAAAQVEGSLGGGVRAWAQTDRSVRAALIPRLGNELGTMTAQGLAVIGQIPGSEPVVVIGPDRPLEEISRAEVGLAREEGAWPALEVRLRGVEIRHAVSAEGGLLSRFSPNGYAFLPPEALDRTVGAASVTVGGSRSLRYGFRLEAWGTGRSSNPSWRDQLWMTPWEGAAALSLHRGFFENDLRISGFLRGSVSGRRATPQGILPSSDRYDAGASARVDRLTLFVVLLNLEDDISEAAAYDAGWVYLPRRSYRTGLSWRFVD